MAITEWLIHLPIWLTFLVTITFWLLVALVFGLLVAKFVPKKRLELAKDNTVRVASVVSALYAFLLGFVVSQEWGNVNSARSDIANASAAIYTAGYNAAALPSASGQKVYVALQKYANSIVCDDLVSLTETGRPSTKTGKELEVLFSTVTSLPSSATGSPSYSNVLSAVETNSQSRRQWITSASGGLPFTVLVIIFAVAFILIGAFSLQYSKSQLVHVLTLLSVAVFIGLGTGLVISFNRPFAGAATIDAKTFTDGANVSAIDCANPKINKKLPTTGQ